MRCPTARRSSSSRWRPTDSCGTWSARWSGRWSKSGDGRRTPECVPACWPRATAALPRAPPRRPPGSGLVAGATTDKCVCSCTRGRRWRLTVAGVAAARLSRRGAGPPGQLRTAAGAHRHHHGRQRPLGRAPPPAARRGPSGRHQRRPRNGRNLGAAGHRGPHAVRLLDRELEAAGGRSQHADGAAQAVSAARAGHAPPEQHPFRVIGRHAGTAPDIQHELATPRSTHGRQHRAALQHRAQLRRPRRNRRCRAAR